MWGEGLSLSLPPFSQVRPSQSPLLPLPCPPQPGGAPGPAGSPLLPQAVGQKEYLQAMNGKTQGGLRERGPLGRAPFSNKASGQKGALGGGGPVDPSSRRAKIQICPMVSFCWGQQLPVCLGVLKRAHRLLSWGLPEPPFLPWGPDSILLWLLKQQSWSLSETAKIGQKWEDIPVQT